MKKATFNIRRWVNWTGGLLAAWVLMPMPVAWAAERPAVPERQTYVSCTSGQRQDNSPDCSSTVYHQKSIALVSLRAGFSFLPFLLFSPSLLLAFYRVLGIEQLGRFLGSFFCFGFLSFIFEHQIAINAP